MRYYLIVLLLFVLSLSDKALAQKSIFRKADHEFSRMRYKTAILYYEKGLATDSLDILSVERLALSYKNIRDYENAEKWFARAIYLSPENKKYYLPYAEALASNKKYESSSYWYRKLGATGDPRGISFFNAYNAHLSAFYADSTQWHIRFTSLNTTFDEFSPVFYKKGLLFSSNRHVAVRNKFISGWDLNPFIDLYLAEDTADIKDFEIYEVNQTEKPPVKRPSQIQDNRTVGDFGVRGLSGSGVYSFNEKPTKATRLKGELRSKYHDGPVTLNGDQTFMMFTRNNLFKGRERLSRDGVNMLKLYSAIFTNNKWTDIKEFNYNSNQYSTAHPALSSDGKILYFSSDMPGGAGGMDLYYSIKQGSKWSRPVNLGSKVNTKGDEIFPFLSGTNVLYFSSTGLPGLGGMDIFKVSIADYLPAGQPENIGYPANSAKDDFGIVLRPGTYSGFFSSNRMGNDDIYSFEYTPALYTLSGIVVNPNDIPVSDATVLINSGIQSDTLKTLSDGTFAVKLRTNGDYQVQSIKEGIRSETSPVSTRDKGGPGEIAIRMTLPIEHQSVVKNNATLMSPGGESAEKQGLPGKLPHHQALSGRPDQSMQDVALKEPEPSHAVLSAMPGTQQKIPVPPNSKSVVQKKIVQQAATENLVKKDTTPIIKTQDISKKMGGRETVKRVQVQMQPLSGPQEVGLTSDCAELQKKYFVDNIYYTTDQAYIRKSEIPVLEHLTRLMNDHPDLQVIVNSHTDSTASDQYNEDLSNKRSMVVKGYLVSRGINEKRIQTRYFGKQRPLIKCATGHCSAEILQLNRRTEFYIILNGKNVTAGCTDVF